MEFALVRLFRVTAEVLDCLPSRFIFECMVSVASLVCAGLSLATPAGGEFGVLTAADAIASTRFMPAGDSDDNLVSLSPDGNRYVVRTVRGDLRNNGVWIAIITGSLKSLDLAAAPSIAARRFSTGLGQKEGHGADRDAFGLETPILWLDDRRIAFLSSNGGNSRQVVVVDLVARTTRQETHHNTRIHSFAIAPDGTLLYLAHAKGKKVSAFPKEGYVVPEGADALSLAEGHLDGSDIYSRAWDSEWFLQRPNQKAKRLAIGGREVDRSDPNYRLISVSPSGAFAVIGAPALTSPVDWDKYAKRPGALGLSLTHLMNAVRANPSGYESREVMQLFIVNLRSGASCPLSDAVTPLHQLRASWSPDSQIVSIASFLSSEGAVSSPTNDGDLSVNLKTADILAACHEPLAVGMSASQNMARIRAPGSRPPTDATSKVSSSSDDAPHNAAPAVVDTDPGHAIAKVFVRQDLNTPPKLYGTDVKSGTTVLILDPNPDLSTKYRLGHVELITGRLSSGAIYSASLTLPANYELGKKYPLVLQTQGPPVRENAFSLFGGRVGEYGLGPPFIAAYAAQALAGRQISVLHFNVDAKWATPSEADTTQLGFEELAERLVRDGIADPAKVGISGFSRMGYFAYHALSHSSFPFAAAVVADNYDPSYIQTVLTNTYSDAEHAIGAPPFGDGLETWLQRTTGFNVDKIRAPLLLIGQSLGVRSYILEQWEILSRLRRLNRPVEMYLMPDMDTHPSHNPQNPRQALAVQSRTVDWFDFWLNGHEELNPAKANQYKRWRVLRQLRDAEPALEHNAQ